MFTRLANETATTVIYTLSLHDALPILGRRLDAERTEIEHERPRYEQHENDECVDRRDEEHEPAEPCHRCSALDGRSEEHTSELQSRLQLVCRLLLEKKKTK